MRKISKKVIILGLLVTVFGVGFLAVLKFGFNDTIVQPIVVDGQTIDFIHTDENKKETLIIKSDQEHYTGDSGSDVYFSVTNTSKIDESAILLFYFPGQFISSPYEENPGEPATVTLLEQRQENTWQKVQFFSKNIKINDEMLGKSITKRKPIPEDFEIKAGAQIEVPAGQTVYFKSRISFRPTDSGEFWIEALGKNGGYGLLDPTYTGTRYGSKVSTDTVASWFASGSFEWTHRKKISISKSKVSGGANLSNFPVLFSVIDSNLKTTTFGGKAASGSGEFVFTSSDGTTLLPHEIEKYSSVSGEFIGWVNVTTLSATNNTDLYIYYGGPAAGGASNQNNKTGVWDSNYKGVWHLNEPNNSTTVVNSTGGTKGTKDSNTVPSTISAKIANGLSFSFPAQVAVADGFGITNTFTVEAWIKPTACSGVGISLVYTTTANGYMIYSGGTKVCDVSIVRNNAGVARYSDANTVKVNSFNHIAATSNGTTAKLYAQGVSLEVNTGTSLPGAAAGNTRFARQDQLTGTMDEIRISNVVRTAGWITTGFNNQSSPSTFYSLGAQEAKIPTNFIGLKYGSKVSTDTVASWFASGSFEWTHRKKISINKSKVSGGANLSNFPILFSVTDTNLKTTTFGGKAASGSGEFVFTSSDGTTVLPHEIERYSSVSGEFIGWVNVTTLSATNDTNLYIYYGGPAAGGASNQNNKTGVWDSNYKGVWHLPNGTTLGAKDSTSNANDGTITSVTAINAKVDGGGSFDGSTSMITKSANASVNNLTNMTVDAWVYVNAFTNTRGSVLAKDTGDLSLGWVVFSSSARLNLEIVRGFSGGGGWWGTGINSISTGQWYHLAVTHVGTTAKPIFYLNGVQVASPNTVLTPSGALNAETNSLNIGGISGFAATFFDGQLDEVRLSNAVRTAGWIRTEYNNQNSPSSFYALGAQEKNTGTSPGLKLR